MTGCRRGAVRAACLMLPLVGCSAPPPTPAPPQQATSPVVGRIDVRADGEDLATVMDRIGRQVDRNVVVDPTVQEVVTVDLVAVPWREAVDVIARLCRCEVEERPDGILVLTQPQWVTIQGEANARTVLQLLAAYEGRNVVIPDEVKGPALLKDREGHPRELMRQVLAGIGDFEVIELDDDTLHIVPRSR